MDTSQYIGAVGLAVIGASGILLGFHELRKWWYQMPEQVSAAHRQLTDDEKEYGPPFP